MEMTIFLSIITINYMLMKALTMMGTRTRGSYFHQHKVLAHAPIRGDSDSEVDYGDLFGDDVKNETNKE